MIQNIGRKLLVVLFAFIIIGLIIFLRVRTTTTPTQYFSTKDNQTVEVVGTTSNHVIELSSSGNNLLQEFLDTQGFWKEGAINSQVYYAQSGRFQIKHLQINFVDQPQSSLLFKGIEDLGSVGIVVEPKTSTVSINVHATQYLLNTVKEPGRSTQISSMILNGIFRTIHPLVGDLKKSEGFDIDAYIRDFEKENKSIVSVKKKTGFSFVKPVYADACSNYHYDLGAAQLVKSCTGGGTPGASCNDSSTCSGGTCDSRWRCVTTNPGGGNCVMVSGGPGFQACAPGSLGNCDNGNCPAQVSTGGGATRVCGNGLCEPGENTTSCPADCTSTGGSSGGGGNTCTGACFGGLNNCGEVGRIPVSGSCSNGELCCGFGPPVGVPCRIWDHVPVTVYVGQTIRVGFNGFVYGGIWGMSTAVTSNPLVANIFPLSENHCCNAVFGGVAQNFYITGLIPGSTWITDRWDINNQGSCQNSMLVNVISNSVVPTITLTANGTAGQISVNSGSNVTLDWRATNVDDCTASNAWSGDKLINGSEIQNNVTTNRRYTLTCTGIGGTATASVNVNINGGPSLPLVNLNINNSPVQVVYVPQIPNVWPYGINTWFSWTSQNATSCVGVSRPHNYPYPRNILLGPFPGWYLWDWTKPLSQIQSNSAAIGTLADTFFDLTCTGPGGTATDTIQVITGQVPDVVGDCQIPQPNDPPTSVCAPSPTANGSITWEWPPVAGANQYSVVIQTVPGFTDVLGTASGVQSSAFFNCTATVCRYTTSLPAGTYRSSIVASNSADICLPSAAGTSAPYTLDLCPVAAWWQGGAGNILSEGLITSQVPYNTLNFIEDGTSGIPGLVSGTAINTGSGAISSTGWSTNSTYGGTIPTYDDFYAQVPAGTTFIDPGANITPASLQSGGTADAAGYHWYRHTGDVTITGDVLIPSARKDILFVDGGDVNINGKIQFANRSNSFFMVIAKPTAGGLKGDIKVRSTVTAATGTPALEGMFCGSHMTTGAGNTPLVVRGSVVLTGGITLERDLAGGNNTEAAEKFVQSPELMYNYPPALTFKRLSWQEVAP